MNSVIKRELDKVRVSLPEYDDDTTHLYIPKKELLEATFQTGKSYLVKIEDYVVNEPPNFTLSSNWNKGVKPKSHHLLIHIIDISGKMLKVMARDFDIETQTCLEGIYNDLWLPLSALNKINELPE